MILVDTTAPVASDVELLASIAAAPVFGLGIGYVDAGLPASAQLAPGTGIWTRDKRLLAAAQGLGLARSPAT